MNRQTKKVLYKINLAKQAIKVAENIFFKTSQRHMGRSSPISYQDVHNNRDKESDSSKNLSRLKMDLLGRLIDNDLIPQDFNTADLTTENFEEIMRDVKIPLTHPAAEELFTRLKVIQKQQQEIDKLNEKYF